MLYMMFGDSVIEESAETQMAFVRSGPTRPSQALRSDPHAPVGRAFAEDQRDGRARDRGDADHGFFGIDAAT